MIKVRRVMSGPNVQPLPVMKTTVFLRQFSDLDEPSTRPVTIEAMVNDSKLGLANLPLMLSKNATRRPSLATANRNFRISASSLGLTPVGACPSTGIIAACASRLFPKPGTFP